MAKFFSLPKSKTMRVFAGIIIIFIGYSQVAFPMGNNAQALGYSFFAAALISWGVYIIYRGIKGGGAS